MKSMENSVREKVTTVYAKVMFDSIREAGDGMAEARMEAASWQTEQKKRFPEVTGWQKIWGFWRRVL